LLVGRHAIEDISWLVRSREANIAKAVSEVFSFEVVKHLHGNSISNKRMDQPSDSTVRPCEFNNRIVYESGLLQMRESCVAFKGDGKTYPTKPYSLKTGCKYACQGCWSELQKYGMLHFFFFRSN
jgi:hypothetical protein